MAKKVGRPKAEIDLNMLEVLCRVQATQAEIAAELHVTVRTLQNAIKRDAKVREAYENGRLRGKASLRRMLIKRANAGSDACLIFALKNICGMSDRVQSEVTGRDGGPLKVSTTANISADVVDTFLSQLEKAKIAQGTTYEIPSKDITPRPQC